MVEDPEIAIQAIDEGLKYMVATTRFREV